MRERKRRGEREERDASRLTFPSFPFLAISNSTTTPSLLPPPPSNQTFKPASYLSCLFYVYTLSLFQNASPFLSLSQVWAVVAVFFGGRLTFPTPGVFIPFPYTLAARETCSSPLARTLSLSETWACSERPTTEGKEKGKKKARGRAWVFFFFLVVDREREGWRGGPV